MDGRRFDSWSKAVARRSSRRTVLRSTGVGLAAVLGGVAGLRGATAQEATPDGTASAPSLLFVQIASSGSFAPNPQVGTPAVEGTPTVGGGADYLLTLEGHHGATIYFSDRPDRIFGDWPTQEFLDVLGFTPANPPNAALVTQADEDAEDEVLILELIEPTYDEATDTLTYGATVLGGYAGEPLTAIVADQDADVVPETFGRASLFIDSLNFCTYTSCRLPGGVLAFPIPGGPYRGEIKMIGVDSGMLGGLPYLSCKFPASTLSDLTAICTADPHCPQGQVCTPS